MRKFVTIALLAAAPALFADGNTATQTATASVNLYAPIVLTKTSDVNFGVYVFSGSDTTVSMDNGGAISGGGTTFTGTLDPALKLATTGKFQWTKDAGLTVDVTVNGEKLTNNATTLLATPLQLGNPNVQWIIKADIVSPSLSTGKLVLYGDLKIAAQASTGSYSATFPVTVAYN